MKENMNFDKSIVTQIIKLVGSHNHFDDERASLVKLGGDEYAALMMELTENEPRYREELAEVRFKNTLYDLEIIRDENKNCFEVM